MFRIRAKIVNRSEILFFFLFSNLTIFNFSRELTWRDVQHITVLSSKRNRLFDPYLKHHWKFNGAGLQFNHLFGYGVMDAGAMVDLSRKWKPLPERFHCTAGSVTEKM